MDGTLYERPYDPTPRANEQGDNAALSLSLTLLLLSFPLLTLEAKQTEHLES